MENRVLVIEDEQEIREMLNFSLTRAGFSVEEADSAEAALNQLDGPLPSLLIIDWMLPGMSGVELARRLRRDEHTANLPMIMLTARGEETDKLKSFDSGMDDYLTKPFSPKELIARMRALLRRTGTPENGIIASGPLRLDLKAHKLSIDGQAVEGRDPPSSACWSCSCAIQSAPLAAPNCSTVFGAAASTWRSARSMCMCCACARRSSPTARTS